MPLITPGIQSQGEGKTEEWLQKLAGKQIGEHHSETTFAKTDLPKEHRILKPGAMKTMDFNPNRLNIHTNDDGTISSKFAGAAIHAGPLKYSANAFGAVQM